VGQYKEPEVVDIKAELRHETPLAFMIHDDDGHPVWLPKSQVEHNSDSTFTVPHWLAKDKGLI
jgi:hypothetical protein